FPEVFSESIPSKLPPRRAVNHRIPLKNSDLPKNPPPYKVPYKWKPQLDALINKDLSSGRIYKPKEVNTEYAAPIFCVPKPGRPNEPRFVFDLRRRNDSTNLVNLARNPQPVI